MKHHLILGFAQPIFISMVLRYLAYLKRPFPKYEWTVRNVAVLSHHEMTFNILFLGIQMYILLVDDIALSLSKSILFVCQHGRPKPLLEHYDTMSTLKKMPLKWGHKFTLNCAI